MSEYLIETPLLVARTAISDKRVLLEGLKDVPDRFETCNSYNQKMLQAALRVAKSTHGGLPIHQLTGAFRFLKQSAKRGSHSSLSTPCVLTTSLYKLVQSCLCWGEEGVSIQSGQVFKFHSLNRYVFIEQLVCFALSVQCLDGDRPQLLSRKWSADRLREVFRGPLIPLPDNFDISRLAEMGLPELHRHDSLTLLPILQWAKTLKSPFAILNDRDPNENTNFGLTLFQWAVLLKHTKHLRDCIAHFLREPQRETIKIEVVEKVWSCLSDPGGRFKNLDRLNTPYWLSKQDPTSFLPGGDEMAPYGERALLCAAFRHLVSSSNVTFVRAFHIYLVVQNIYNQWLIQDIVGEKGLQRFVTDYASGAQHDLSSNDRRQQLVQAYRTGRVSHLELRVTPSQSVYKLQSKLKRIGTAFERSNAIDKHFNQARRRDLFDCFESDLSAGRPAVGVIVHFLKQREHQLVSSPRYPLYRPLPRHAILRKKAWREASVIRRTWEASRFGGLLLGLDVANDEISAPTEVFASPIRALRNSSVVSGDYLPHQHKRWQLRRPGLSVHAGEDFLHILSGMRAVNETTEFLRFGSGDRIGHALAIGLFPEQWASQLPRTVIMPRGELFDNLVWFFAQLLDKPAFGDVRQRVESELRRVTRLIYPTSCFEHDMSPSILFDSWRWRSVDPFALRIHPATKVLNVSRFWMSVHDVQDAREAYGTDAELLWKAWHYDSNVRENWSKLIEVSINRDWFEAIEAVQNGILRDLCERRIAIEINPSSNLSIGPISTIEEHPVFRWFPPGSRPPNNMPVVVVGSDDPAVFGTEIVHEYALLAEAAERLGYTPTQISDWLRQLRQNGLRYSFIPGSSGGSQTRI